MKIEGAVALVTGGQRGIGAAIVAELLERGAAKVYATARNPKPDADPRVMPVRLDVTDEAAVQTLAATAADVTILINNAGSASGANLLTGSFEDLRADFETNVFGVISVLRALAPVLKANGGGAVLNVHSALSWASTGDGYSASKAAVWSVTNGVRGLLAPAGTHVVGLHVGYVDTDLTAGLDVKKVAPELVARLAVQGIADGATEVLVDDVSRHLKSALPGDPKHLALVG